MAKYLDYDGILYFWQKIKLLFATKTDLDGKVDKVNGKGLSTEDYTSSEKTKLSGIAEGAEVNPRFYPHTSDAGLLIAGFRENGDNTVSIEYTKDGGTSQNSVYVATDKYVDSAVNDKATKSQVEAAMQNALTTVRGMIDSAVTNMYKYKGSVSTVSALPSSDNTTGDVYNVESTGMNYAWNGTEWDALGEIFTIASISNSDIDTIVAS